ncbi:hypothetical protein ACLD9W_08830 [Neisseria sp. WLZKY-1]|uniref:hypothetical protein n=1 Tax=Neisseria sp. WLZKY-1 TaxID=3390377 RepID=UPI00397DB8F1
MFDGDGFVLAHDVSFVNDYGNEAAAVAAKRFSDDLSLFVTYYNNIQLYCNGVFGRIFCGMRPKGCLAAGVGNLFEGRLKNGFSDGLIRD